MTPTPLTPTILALAFALFGCADGPPENGAHADPAAGLQDGDPASGTAASRDGDPTRPGGWRLADADSPYLRSHADNAVDWHAWGEDAFELARRLDRPVFLSIGYSACHWCHVMEHESFEDEATGAYLREHFVSIKVDREQHPDVDAHYMQAVQRMTGQGGWPLTAFLTPDARVFFGGTYFPDEPGFGRPSFLQVLEHVTGIWTDQREELMASLDGLTEQLTMDVLPAAGAFDGARVLRAAAANLQEDLDAEHGGVRGSQKFPPAMALEFLLRSHARGLDVDLALLETTLDAMASRGLRDHVGGGFHRYCVDPQWLVPHFEKMLYDNALLAPTYAAAARATGHERHAEVARDTLAWLMADMRSPEGLYYAARDADSLPFDADGRPLADAHPEEGDVYTWTPDELRAVLGADDAAHVARLFGVSDAGNFERGRSIPRPMRPLVELAAAPGEGLPDGAAFLDWWRGVRAKLLATRDGRPQAFRDEKCLTSWNGLTLTAFARCASLLDDPALAAEAGRLGHAALEHLLDADGELAHQRFEGRSSGRANLSGHANLARGLLDAWEATDDGALLAASVTLTRRLLERFEDEDGRLAQTTGDDPLLPGRRHELQDGARPAGHSVALELLLRLAPLDDSGTFRDAAERALARLGPWVGDSPRAFPALLAALDAATGPLAEVVIDRAPTADADALLREARTAWLPAAVRLLDARAAADALVPDVFAELPSLLDGKVVDEGALAFVCQHGVCQLPAADAETLRAQWALVRGR